MEGWTGFFLEDWADEYLASAAWYSVASAVFVGGDWPEGVQSWQGKLIRDGMISVPERLARLVVWDQHARTGHFGRRRLVRELKRRFILPPSIDVWKEVAEVRTLCKVCQACEVENQTLRVEERPQPVIDQFLAIVRLEIFDMPAEELEGQIFDCFLLCVDRFTGWMLAQTTRKEGLTGEKAAKLLCKNCWGEIGVPENITTDQDP